jgi:hypothetical protein
MSQSQAKRQRRQYELWLKKNNPAAYREWKSKAAERGASIHASNVEAVRNAETERLEKTQTDIIVRMKSEGRTDAEIDRYIGIWVKTLSLWASDEPKMSWKEATREYDKELASSKKSKNDNDTAN